MKGRGPTPPPFHASQHPHHLTYVVPHCHQSELQACFIEAPQGESIEAVVALDVAEHGLHVDGALLAQMRSPHGMQHLARPLPEKHLRRVDLDPPHEVLGLAFGAHSLPRAFRAAFAAVDASGSDVSQIVLRSLLTLEEELPAFRTGVGVSLFSS